MKQLLKSFTENPVRIFIALAIDILALYLYGFITNPIRNQIINRGTEAISAHLRGQNAFSLSLFFWFITFLIITYLIWTVWQATTWYISRLLVGMKHNFLPYLLDLTRLNVIWIIIYGIILATDTYFSVRAILIRAIIPDYTNLPSIIIATVSIITLYFAIISQSVRSIARSLNEGLHLHTFLTVAGLFIILYLLDKALKLLPFDVSLLLGFFALILFTPARMIITHVTNHGLRTRA
jgi:hypothetical protein